MSGLLLMTCFENSQLCSVHPRNLLPYNRTFDNCGDTFEVSPSFFGTSQLWPTWDKRTLNQLLCTRFLQEREINFFKKFRSSYEVLNVFARAVHCGTPIPPLNQTNGIEFFNPLLTNKSGETLKKKKNKNIAK